MEKKKLFFSKNPAPPHSLSFIFKLLPQVSELWSAEGYTFLPFYLNFSAQKILTCAGHFFQIIEMQKPFQSLKIEKNRTNPLRFSEF